MLDLVEEGVQLAGVDAAGGIAVALFEQALGAGAGVVRYVGVTHHGDPLINISGHPWARTLSVLRRAGVALVLEGHSGGF